MKKSILIEYKEVKEWKQIQVKSLNTVFKWTNILSLLRTNVACALQKNLGQNIYWLCFILGTDTASRYPKLNSKYSDYARIKLKILSEKFYLQV